MGFTLNTMQMVGLIITIALIAGMAIFSGTRAKKSGKISWPIVSGIIMGTLVGGSSTVGTAQLAYNYGMSAWWFTLGGGIACLILALVYAGPLRKSGCETLVGAIRQEYGPTAGMCTSILNSVGTFINIISQLLAASAVVLVVWPNMATLWTVIISAVFMVIYVVFGGTKGAGMVGILKLAFLYIAMVACGIVVLKLTGGAGNLLDMVRGITPVEGAKEVNYFSIFARGAGTDVGAGLSLILGVLTTQTYAQGILTAKSDKDARAGALISAVLIPIIGIFGIMVGLYMRATVPDPATFVAKTALTQFALTNLPSILAGVVLGALFIASVGTGAGLALGIATIVNNDIIKRYTHKFDDPKKSSAVSKLIIVIVLAIACCMSTGSLGDTILNFAFMSMGLRGAVVFIPLCGALWLKNRIDKKFAIVSIIVSPIAVLIFGIVKVFPFDSLFIGIIASIIIMGVGLIVGKKQPDMAK